MKTHVFLEQPSHPWFQVASGYAGSGVYGGSPVYTGAQYQYQPAPMTYAAGPWGYGGCVEVEECGAPTCVVGLVSPP